MSDMLPEGLKGGRRAGADDLAFLPTSVAKPMRQGALEIVTVACPQDPRFAAYREFDFSPHDHTPLLAGVGQHFLAGIRIGRVSFVQDRHAALDQTRSEE